MQGKEFEAKNTPRWQEYEQAVSGIEKKSSQVDVSSFPAMFKRHSTRAVTPLHCHVHAACGLVSNW